MNVYIPSTGFATQGPCASGFHIPTKTEAESLISAFTATGLSGYINFSTYLKIPISGNRAGGTGSDTGGGTNGFIWTCEQGVNNGSGYAYRILFNANYVRVDENALKYNGYAIRPFKNTIVTPDSSWTALYSDKIYHNSTLGLISIKSGNTWITISDKNVGATSVYNYGDTMSEANCGKFYQWGNNYGFPFTGSVTTSGTVVNVSTYGPGNYYSSSTFITTNPRDSPVNGNLRGGVDGNVNITTMNELNNAYIGEPPLPDYLCFTANTAGSTVKLNKVNSPTSVTLETSTDGENWSTYTFGDTITLTNVGDKVWWRNISTTTTGFNTASNQRYTFAMTGSINGDGDITSLINKNFTKTLVGNYCFAYLFLGCESLKTSPKLPATTLTENCYEYMLCSTGLITAPSLPATTLAKYCYRYMFYSTASLEQIPAIPATTIGDYSCQQMFYGCTNIKISSTKTGEYVNDYRIPTNGTGTGGTGSFTAMFQNTGGTFTGTPSINTTYYTSNTVE